MHERDILLAALEKDRPEEREAYLTHACGKDAELRSRIQALLRASEVQDSFLESPAVETEVLSRETDAIRQEVAEHDEPSLDFLHPTDDPSALGRLGQYTITEVIGRGGMGVVLKANDPKLNRIVAIKVLAPELASNPTARKRFQREAHAAAAVVHQHIVTIHAVDEDRLPYLVMECIDGQSLKEKIDREGQLQLIEIVRIGQQVAAGLAAAHAHGLMHRDVKPANILLENGVERVRITDFGLARAVDDVGMTRTGEVAGTPQYMSPEQAQGLPMDVRSDLFSFGCVLYAMCTGRPPFRADSTPAVLHRVCHDTPRPIQEINPEIPDWLAAIVDRLLKKQPSDRFQSAQQIAALLGQHLAHLQQPALIPRPEKALAAPHKTARRWGQWSVTALIALLAVACALGLTEASGVTAVVPTVIRIVRGEGTLVIEVGDPNVQVSVDGDELKIRGAGLNEFRLVAGKYRVHATKDGQPFKDELVTITRGDRKVVSVALEWSGGAGSSNPERKVDELKLLAKLEGHSDLVLAAAFLPDARRMVSVSFDRLARIWDLPTRTVLSTLPMELGRKAADMSADGRLVAVVSHRDGKCVVRVWNIEKREVVCQFAPELNQHNCIRFTPDGTRLVTSGLTSGVPQPYGVLWDAATGEELGRFDMSDTDGVHEAAFSPDGRLLALGAAGRVRLFDIESRDVVADVPLPKPWNVWDLEFAPSGKALATGQAAGHVSLIEVGSWRVVKTLQGSGANRCSLRFLGTDTFLLTSSGDATLRVWDLEQGKVLARAATENGPNHGLFVSPDGRQVVTAGGKEWDDVSRSMKDYGDYALRLWQLPESVWPKASQTEMPEAGDFVLLGGKGVAEQKFDTLANAVESTNDGDTIEIRGNGPFTTEPIKTTHALTIRAGEGYRPVVRLSAEGLRAHAPMLVSESSLVLEGLEIQRLGPDRKEGDPWRFVLKAEKELHIANCRFLMRSTETCLQTNAAVCELRNSEFLCPGWSSSFNSGDLQPGQRLVVENCLFTAGCEFVYLNQLPNPVRVRLARNTFRAGPLWFYLQRENLDDVARDGKVLEVEASDNLFDGGFVVRFEQYQRSRVLPVTEAEKTLVELLDWKGERNLFATGEPLVRLVEQKGDQKPENPVETLAAWRTFWETPEVDSIEGLVRYQGGDLLTRFETAPEQLTPQDWRLREDSAGHRAGKDGKDLGADVDLVGPGAAYERWKKTPEYQTWLKDTGQLRAEIPKPEPGAFVLLGGKGVAERKFDTLAEAVQSASAGDTIEVRGNGPFVTEPIKIGSALTIRAAAGCRPVIQMSLKVRESEAVLLETSSQLVLEGLEFQDVSPKRLPGAKGPRTVGIYLEGFVSSLYIANCRFVMRDTLHIRAGGVCELRNCEFVGGYSGYAVQHDLHTEGQLVLDNCVQVGGFVDLAYYADNPEKVTVRLTRNTLLADHPFHVSVNPVSLLPKVAAAGEAHRAIEVIASGNVFDGRSGMFYLANPIPEPAAAVTFLGRWLAWRGQHNVYPTGVALLYVGPEMLPPTPDFKGLAAWKEFWATTEAGSLQGHPKYWGGDLRSRAAAAPESVTPEDFRLRSDSPGYRAGKDGKDLGADVDLVGPGEAYERWKQSPEYQEWLKETNQLRAQSLKAEPGAFVLAVEKRKAEALAREKRLPEIREMLLRQREAEALAQEQRDRNRRESTLDAQTKLVREHTGTVAERVAKLGSEHRDTRSAMGGLAIHCTNLALLQVQAGNFSEAIFELDEATQLAHGNDDLYAMSWTSAAPVYLYVGDVERYRSACEWLLDHADRLTAKDPLGRSYPLDQQAYTWDSAAITCSLAPDSVRDFSRVERLAERCITGTENHPARRHLILTKGLTEYRTGRYRRAVDWLEQFALHPIGNHYDAIGFVALAMAQHHLGDGKGARASLRSAHYIVAGFSRDKHAHDYDRLHGVILCREADALITGIMVPPPGEGPVKGRDHVAQAQVYAVLEDWSYAQAEATQAIDDNPRNSEAWLLRARAHHRVDQKEQAIADAVAAFEISTDLSQSGEGQDWFLLAMAHWQLGEKDMARDLYDRAVKWREENEPDDEELRRLGAEAKKLIQEEQGDKGQQESRKDP